MQGCAAPERPPLLPQRHLPISSLWDLPLCVPISHAINSFSFPWVPLPSTGDPQCTNVCGLEQKHLQNHHSRGNAWVTSRLGPCGVPRYPHMNPRLECDLRGGCSSVSPSSWSMYEPAYMSNCPVTWAAWDRSRSRLLQQRGQRHTSGWAFWARKGQTRRNSSPPPNMHSEQALLTCASFREPPSACQGWLTCRC